MGNFSFYESKIKGLYIIEPKVFGDNRGYFMENYNKKQFEAAGFNMNFVQDNESKSVKGVLRGLHFQREHSQGKLIRVTKGEVFDVAVDLRNGSKTYGNWEGIVLSEENKKQFYVPEGFAHGFLVISNEAILNYKCTDYYAKEYECGIMWNDPDINVNWPLENIENVILSEKEFISYNRVWEREEGDLALKSANIIDENSNKLSIIFPIPYSSPVNVNKKLIDTLKKGLETNFKDIEVLVVGRIPEEIELFASKAPMGSIRWWPMEPTDSLETCIKYAKFCSSCNEKLVVIPE